MTYSYLFEGKRVEEELSPSFTLKADVLVVGVGSSGTYAAISAARAGAFTVALERGESVGGMFTSGGVTGYYYGERGGDFEDTEMEALSLDKHFAQVATAADVRSALMTEKLFSAGVKLYTGATVIGVFLENSTVLGTRALIRGTLVDISCTNLVDATSDGFVLRMCPVRTSFGRPTDKKTAPFTCWTTVLDGGVMKGMNVDDGYCNQYEPWQFTDAVVRAHASKLAFCTESSRIIKIAPTPGVREGISFLGEEVISYKNILASRDPERILFVARSDLDKHGTDIALDEDEYQNFWCISNLATVTVRIPVPIGAVIPKGVLGLITAGRCLSVDSYALGAVRMNRDMMRMGECVGLLAAIASCDGVCVRDVDYGVYSKAADSLGCRLGKTPDRFAFDSPNGKSAKYEPVDFDMSDEQIIERLATDSPGVAIYSCRLSDGHIIPKIKPYLNSSDEKLALGAALALGIMGDSSCVPVLRRAAEKRSPEIFVGCRRSNQFKSATAICMLARFGTEEDISLLSEIIFDPAEREKKMYLPENTPSLAYSKNDVRFCYFQHFTHALIAACKIAKRCGYAGSLIKKINDSFDSDGLRALVDYITFGKPDTPYGEATAAAVEYAKALLE